MSVESKGAPGGSEWMRTDASAGYVLLTGKDEIPPDLVDSLGAAVEVRHCAGAPDVECPAVRGLECPLRQDAKAAVVFLAGEHEFFLSRRWQCVTAGTTPAVVVLEGTDRSTYPYDGFAIVGAAEGTVGVLEALAAFADET